MAQIGNQSTAFCDRDGALHQWSWGPQPTTVLATWACWTIITVPDLGTKMIRWVDVLTEEEMDMVIPTWALAVVSCLSGWVATTSGEGPTFRVARRVVVPGVIAMVLMMVVSVATLGTVGTNEDHLGGDSCGHWPLVQPSRSSLGCCRSLFPGHSAHPAMKTAFDKVMNTFYIVRSNDQMGIRDYFLFQYVHTEFPSPVYQEDQL